MGCWVLKHLKKEHSRTAFFRISGFRPGLMGASCDTDVGDGVRGSLLWCICIVTISK